MLKTIQGSIQRILLLFGLFLVLLILFLSQDITKEIGLSTPPDAVVILGGGHGLRVKGAVPLINYFPVKPMVFFTGGDLMFGKKTTSLMTDYALSLNMKAMATHAIDSSMSTFDDATHLKRYLADHTIQIKRLLVVTSKYHTGRSYWVFQHVFSDQDIEIGIIGTNDYIDHERWWFDYHMSEIILIEKARFLFYRLVSIINPSIMNT